MDYSCFKDQVVVITGAGGETGGGTAVEMARWGAKIALIDIHEGRLSEVVKKCRDLGLSRSKMLDRIGDVTKEDQAEKFIEDTVRKFGRINVLVNVVGAKRIKTLQNGTWQDMEWCINGNIRSVWIMCKLCLPHLLETKGNIVNISSVSGGRPVWGALPYAMAKASVDQFTRCTSQELAPKGVRVNAVAPGALKSEFNFRFGDVLQEEHREIYFDVASRSIPLGYMGTWEDVVPSVMFLASDKAPFVTGAVVNVDGAYVCTCNNPE